MPAWSFGFGGNNAGHTLVVNGEQFILHLIPSGILHPDKQCLIGNGVVVDLEVLLQEVTTLRERGVALSPANLMMSEKAHLILPYHKHLDACREAAEREEFHRHPGRGIGPCYERRKWPGWVCAWPISSIGKFLRKDKRGKCEGKKFPFRAAF